MLTHDNKGSGIHLHDTHTHTSHRVSHISLYDVRVLRITQVAEKHISL